MQNIPLTVEAGKRLVHFMRFFPPYNIGEGLIAITLAFVQVAYFGVDINYFSWEVAGRPIVLMFVEAVGYFAIVLITESKHLKDFQHWLHQRRVQVSSTRPDLDAPKDADVAAESDRIAEMLALLSPSPPSDPEGTPVPSLSNAEPVHEGGPSLDVIEAGSANKVEDVNEFSIVLAKLVKSYPPTFLGGETKHAVQGMSLALRKGERFGLLGMLLRLAASKDRISATATPIDVNYFNAQA